MTYRFVIKSCLKRGFLVCLLISPFIRQGFSQTLSGQIGEVIEERMSQLKLKYGYKSTEPVIFVSVKNQRLVQMRNDSLIGTYKISTSKYGVGSSKGSNQTPEGVHKIKVKIGDGVPSGTIFKGRKNMGEIANIKTGQIDDKEDHITSRIMWLEGLEPQINRGGEVDSYFRYIYIHGTHEEGLIGKRASHGCIRMINKDVIELFDQVKEGTLVVILND